MVHAFLKPEIKKLGSVMLISRHRSRYSNFSLKNSWFYLDFDNLYQFPPKWFVKTTRIVLRYYMNPVSNIPSAQEKQHL